MAQGRAGDLEDWLRDHGQVLTTAEAEAIGLTRSQRDRLVRRRRLLRPWPGVLVSASAQPGPVLDIRVAVAASGKGAAASHLSAGVLYGLPLRRRASLHVTVPRARGVRLPGVVVHHTRDTTEFDIRHGIRTTSASRGLLEMAGLVGPDALTARELLDGVNAAIDGRFTAIPKLVQVAEARRRRGGPSGAARLLALLERYGYLDGPPPSTLERLLADLLDDLHRNHGIPLPVREHPVEGGRFRLDRAWPDIRLAVEVDGFAWHHTPGDLGADHVRRNALNGRWRIVGFTWRHLVDHPGAVATMILDAYREEAMRYAGRPGWPH